MKENYNNNEEYEIENIDEETLRQMIRNEILRQPTVEEAISEKQRQNDIITKNFTQCYLVLNETDSYRRRMLFTLKYSLLQLNLAKGFSSVLGNGSKEYIEYIIRRTLETKDKIEEDNNLIKNIKYALAKLYVSETTECNYEITLLISAIFDKTNMLISELNEDMQRCNNAIRGITYYGNKDNLEHNDNLNNKINESILKLGLKK